MHRYVSETKFTSREDFFANFPRYLRGRWLVCCLRVTTPNLSAKEDEEPPVGKRAEELVEDPSK
jgi:hypothetical protein